MANRPIIQIEVDDAQFKKFLDVYKDYEKSISDMPATWGKVGEAADKTNMHLKTMMGNIGGIAKGFTSIVGSIAKISAFAVSGAALGGFFGLDKLANGVLQNQRSARAGGVTMGQQSAFRVNTSRYIDPDSFLGAVATARQSPQQLKDFAGLGVDVGQNESNYDLSKAVLRAIREKYKETHNLGLLHALGANDFVSDQEIMTLGAAPEGEFNTAMKTMDRDSTTLGVPTDVASKWATLSVQLDRAGQSIENSLIRGLAQFAPVLDNLSDSMAKSIESILGSSGFKIVMDDLAAELNKFATWLGSPNVQSDLDTFGTSIGTAATDITAALKFLDIIPTTPTPTPPGGTPKPAPPTTVAPDPNNPLQNWPPIVRKMFGWKPIQGDPRYNAMAQKAAFAAAAAANIPDNADTLITPPSTGANTTGGMDFTPVDLKNGLPLGMTMAVAMAENNGTLRTNLTSPEGAQGLMQLMPGVQAAEGVSNPFDAGQSAYGGGALLGDLYKKYGDMQKVVAAYNWGEGNLHQDIDAHGSDWAKPKYLPKETQGELTKFNRYWSQTDPTQRTADARAAKRTTEAAEQWRNTHEADARTSVPAAPSSPAPAMPARNTTTVKIRIDNPAGANVHHTLVAMQN